MADTLQLQKRGPFRSTWTRTRKARPKLILGRRPRRRLRLLRWCGRRRLRRRLLQAQAAGADWREGGWLVSRAAAAPRPKTKAPSPAPSPATSPTPSRAPSPTSDEDTAPSGPASLPIPPLRSAGPGRALLLLPREQVSRRREDRAGGRGEDAAPGPQAGRRPCSLRRYSGREWRDASRRWCRAEGKEDSAEGDVGLQS